jgi:hypothetical protein
VLLPRPLRARKRRGSLRRKRKTRSSSPRNKGGDERR